MATTVPLKGNLKEFCFPEILRWAFVSSWTGELVLSREEVERRVFIRDGTVVFARSNDPNDRLGEVFLRMGKITLRQFEEASEGIMPDKRLGTILVETQTISPKELLWGVKYQIREIVFDLFGWNSGPYLLDAEATLGSEMITLSIHTPKLIFEGVKRMNHWWHIRKNLPPLDTLLECSHGWETRAAELELAGRETILLNLIDGKKNLLQILDDSPFTDFEAARLLMAFLMADLVRETSGGLKVPQGLEIQAYSRIVDLYNSLFAETVTELSRRLGRPSRHKLNPYFLLARATYPELFRFANLDDQGRLDAKVLSTNVEKIKDVHRPAYLQKGLQRLLDEILRGYELLTDPDGRKEIEGRLKAIVHQKATAAGESTDSQA
jgi:hypothetical protein